MFGAIQREYLPAVAPSMSLLHGLQDSIVSDTHHEPLADDVLRQAVRATSDGSIQIHACYGLARQVEALRDAFLHELNSKFFLCLWISRNIVECVV